MSPAPPTKAANPEEPAAAASPAETGRTPETLLIPGGADRPALPSAPRSGPTSWLVVLGLCASGAAWFWWRRRGGESPFARSSRPRQIQIEESRALGNRQYLVLASVAGQRVLLGVTPASIQLLSPVASGTPAASDEPAVKL